MGKKEELFKTFETKASEDDIIKIDENLNSMNRGKIKDIWPKIQALYMMIKDPKAAWTSKATAIASLIYLISPVDAIPDIVPVAGLTDDAAVIIAATTALALQLKKYLIEIEKDKAEIYKRNTLEIEYEKSQNQIEIKEVEEKLKRESLELKKQDEKMKQKFILKTISIIGVFATIITLIIKIM